MIGLLVFGLNSMQRVLPHAKCSFCLNELLNSVQEVAKYVLTALGKVMGFSKCWILLVKSRCFTVCTTQKKGRPNPRNLPDGANYRLATERPDDVSDDGQGWPLTAAS